MKRLYRTIAFLLAFCLLMTNLPSETISALSKKSLLIYNVTSPVLVLTKGKSFKLSFSVNGKKVTVKDGKLKFKSSNKKSVTVTKAGKLFAKRNGKSLITVSGKRLRSTSLWVYVGKRIKKITASTSSISLYENETRTLSCSIAPSNATYQKLLWSSSRTSNVKVSQTGIITAVKAGSAKITAKTLDGTNKKATFSITVLKKSIVTPAPTTVTPTPSAATPTPGEVSPTPGEVSPTPGEVSPTPGEVSPTPGEVSPTPGVATPTPGEATPTPGEATPTPGVATPTPGVVTPTPGVATPTPGVATPTPGVATPTPGVATPTPGEATPTPEPTTVHSAEIESLTLGGSYAGVIQSPFAGVGLYGNNDYAQDEATLETKTIYQIILTGASNNSNQAKVSLYVGGEKKGTYYFDTTTAAESSIKFTYRGDTESKVIKFIEEDDNGNFDVYLDKYRIEKVSTIQAAPTLAATGAAYTNQYRNIFKESGRTDSEIQTKIDTAFQQLFYGDDSTQRIYYPVGDDMAYILDTGNSDVRSEGMSYGMMICVQLNKQEEFNRLWKWARTYMYHDSGERKGWFAWQCSTSGSIKDNNSATDGEEYFATALLFAANRWGNGDGIYDYNAAAQALLTEMVHHKEMTGYYGLCNMFDDTYNLPVFVPYGSAASYSDPSYVLPAFYEVWAQDSENDNTLWKTITSAGRAFFKTTVNSTTGLAPDYANYDGTPNAQGNHGDFRFDAWRVISNIAVDYSWWGKDSWAVTQCNRQLSFFETQGVSSYGNQWSLVGKCLDTDHSPGLVAMNAVGCLASDSDIVWDFIDEFWNIGIPSGQYRYYDGCLYMMGLLHCSGNFKAYLSTTPTAPDTDPSVTPTPTPAVTPTPTPGVTPTVTPSAVTTYILDYNTTHGEYSSSDTSGISFVENVDNTLTINKTSGYSSPKIYVKITLADNHTLSEYASMSLNFTLNSTYKKIGAYISSTTSTDNAFTVISPTSNNIGGTGKISAAPSFSSMSSDIGALNSFYLILSYDNYPACIGLLSSITFNLPD